MEPKSSLNRVEDAALETRMRATVTGSAIRAGMVPVDAAVHQRQGLVLPYPPQPNLRETQRMG
jgi:hypothetical protein